MSYSGDGLDVAARLLVGQVLQVPVALPATDTAGPRKVRELSPGLVSAAHAVVVDGDSGQILWARDANTPVPPASITKIVTRVVGLDNATSRTP
jgi:D-alanyl-D-alanine carboxypeptidase